MAEAAGEEVRINRSGIKGLVVNLVLTLVSVAIIFIVAGTLDWVGAWVYAGLVIGYQIVYSIIMVRVTPSLLNERGKLAKSGTKLFDRIFFVMYLPVTIGGLVLIGLDHRYGWTSMPWWTILIGAALLVISFVPGIWSQIVNPYFECTVRIQEDRGQTVINNGPYQYVRHPGYLGLVLSLASAPLILRSWWGFVPYGFMIVVVIIRTALEDKTLREELPGYMEFAGETRFRLMPFVW